LGVALDRRENRPHLFVHTGLNASTAATMNGVSDSIASIYQELVNAEKTADAVEDSLAVLEQRLDELLTWLESEEKERASNA